jgi:hypothetical protein
VVAPRRRVEIGLPERQLGYVVQSPVVLDLEVVVQVLVAVVVLQRERGGLQSTLERVVSSVSDVTD